MPGSGRDCTNLGCTVHRSCYKDAGKGPVAAAKCSALKTVEKFNEFDDLVHEMKCPDYHELCGTVVQTVPKGGVKVGGKTCV